MKPLTPANLKLGTKLLSKQGGGKLEIVKRDGSWFWVKHRLGKTAWPARPETILSYYWLDDETEG